MGERRLDGVFLRGLDQRGNGFEPGAVTAEELVSWSLGRGGAFRHCLEAVPVHVSPASRPEPEAATDAPDLYEAVAHPLVIEASPGSPGAMSTVAQRLLAEERPSHDRTDAVGTHDDVSADGIGIGEKGLAVLPCADAGRPDVEILDRHRLEHGLLQLTTQDPIRLPSQRLVVDQRQELAVRIANLGAPDFGPARCDTIAKPEEAQRRNRVRREDKTESRLVEFRRALDHDRLDAGSLEGDRSREAADPRTDDNSAHDLQPTSDDGNGGYGRSDATGIRSSEG
jgi:hypothetical protein